ncbi:MAG: hypothetical protein GX443_01035 [Deltaproteobacteria bacterium]|nr:hypothetical protein [Deltaproteobacteria bacterium]
MSQVRSSPGPGVRKVENFRQKRVERFESSLAQVSNHCAGRNTAVAEVLCFLSLLRNSGRIPAGATVSSSGARFQSIKGAAESPAAHCLPCQIYVNGRDPSTLTSNSQAALAIRSCFGKCTLLPLAFNHADSAAESNGLIQAFEQACREVISAEAGSYGRIDRERVRHAYDAVWCPLARQAYRAALSQKGSGKAPLPRVVRGIGMEYGMIDLESLERQRAEISEKQVHLNEVLWILQQYLVKLHVRPTALEDRRMSEMESLWG